MPRSGELTPAILNNALAWGKRIANDKSLVWTRSDQETYFILLEAKNNFFRERYLKNKE